LRPADFKSARASTDALRQEEARVRHRHSATAERLHAVAIAFGMPPEASTRLVAECMASDPAGWPADRALLVSDPALVARLEAQSHAVGVPVAVLGAFFVAIGLERHEARRRGERWASDTAGPSRRAARRPRPRLARTKGHDRPP
jgi:hypothetical protein